MVGHAGSIAGLGGAEGAAAERLGHSTLRDLAQFPALHLHGPGRERIIDPFRSQLAERGGIGRACFGVRISVAEGAVLLKNAEAGLGAQGLIVLGLRLGLRPDHGGGREKKQRAPQKRKGRFLSRKHSFCLDR